MLDVEITQLLNSDSEKMKNLTDLWKINAPYNPVRPVVRKIQGIKASIFTQEPICDYVQAELIVFV